MTVYTAASYTAASVPPRIRIVRSERSTGIPLLQAHIAERFHADHSTHLSSQSAVAETTCGAYAKRRLFQQPANTMMAIL